MASGSTKQNPDYDYTKLSDLRVGSKFNIYGILKEIIKYNCVLATGKLHSILSITDESLPAHTSFRMHVYSKTDLPDVQDGMILRFHRVKVEKFEDKLDGRIFKGQDMLIFPSNHGDNFITLAQSPTLTDEDKARVIELREIVALSSVFPDDESSFDVTSKNRNTSKGIKIAENMQSNKEMGDLSVHSTQGGRVLLGSPRGPHQRLSDSEGDSDSPETLQKQVSNSSRKHSKYNAHDDDCSDQDCIENESESTGSNEEENSEKRNGRFIPNPFNSRFKFRGDATQEQIESFIHSSLPEARKQNGKISKKLKRKLNLKDVHNPKKKLRNSAVRLVEDTSEPSCSKSSGKTKRLNPMACSTPLIVTRSKKSILQGNLGSPASAEIHTATSSLNTMSNGHESPAENVCPGVACAFDCAQKGPVILDDGDPRFEASDEERLVFDGEGDIPACDEDGNNICGSKLATCTDVQDFIVSSIHEMQSYKWPQFHAKVKIVAIKPKIKVLETIGPKDLLSGCCTRCKQHMFYSRLAWDKMNNRKRPMCPFSQKDNRKDHVKLEFRFKLIVKDAWGTQLCLYGVKSNASQFLGCTPKEYQEDIGCRKKVTALLSEALSSKTFIHVQFYKVNTPVTPKYFVCKTNLYHALNN